jgi:dTDP-4-amino-4,6-dideoxygalactose transaminase
MGVRIKVLSKEFSFDMGVEKCRVVPLAAPVFDEEMEVAAVNALRHERFVLGEDVFKFEEEFARYVGSKFAVSTSSGTNALQIALLALGIGRGDEVVTSAFSFIASANAVLHAGATPVFADIDAKDFNVDPKEMKVSVTKCTRALLPVHLYGYPCKMHDVMGVAEDFGLRVIEDACQAHGAEYAGHKTGAIGDVGCFSFYPSKNMTVCGDGGMIVTDDEDVAKLAARLRDCGRKSQYEHDVVGYTSRLNTVNAAIGRVQLRRLDAWNKKRVQVATLYDKLLGDLDEVIRPPIGGSWVEPVYHLYVVRVKRRNGLKAYLQKNGVQCGVHYPLPIPLQPVYKQMFQFKAGECPVSERVSEECLSLPMYPALSVDDVEYVCERIHEFYVNNVVG